MSKEFFDQQVYEAHLRCIVCDTFSAGLFVDVASQRYLRCSTYIEHNIDIYQHYELTKEERADLRASLKKMQKQSTLRATYKNFFTWMGKPELFKPGKNSILEYSDVFPLIYLKIRLEGIKGAQKNVRHLLIDEMQGYTPVQYAVIAKLFPCKKTILGDADQSVNPFSSSTAEKIQKVFRQAECVKLCKSYRSTYEITRFAQRISPNPDLVAIERHGDEPRVLKFKSKSKEIERIRQFIAEFVALGYHTMGIICKTPTQAERLHAILHGEKHNVRLLTSRSTAFTKGVVICTVHLAKGLEFDQVIVPDASDDNYSTDMERNLLYVACTRAMHILILTFVNKVTPFISRA